MPSLILTAAASKEVINKQGEIDAIASHKYALGTLIYWGMGGDHSWEGEV